MSHDRFDVTGRQGTPDNPVFQPRYSVIPGEVIDMVSEGEITPSEAWLLTLIDRYVSVKGVGCFASNAHLAKMMHLEVRQIQYMLTKLVKVGMLRRAGWVTIGPKRFRVLETAWSRITRFTADMEFDPKQESDDRSDVQYTAPRGVQCTAPIDNTSLRSVLREKESAPAAAADRGSGNPLIDGGKGGKQHTWHSDLAERLHDIVANKHKILRSYSERRWGQEFAALAADWGKQRVEEVFAWYEKNWQKRRVQSASSFRRDFEILEGMASRDAKVGQAVVDKDTPKILDTLDGLVTWPNGAAAGLPAAVNASLPAVRDYLTLLYTLVEEGRPLAKFIKYVADELGSTPITFMSRWFRSVAKSVSAWKGWSGNLNQYVFHVEHDLFRRNVLRVAREYDGSERLGLKLLEALK